MYGVEIVPFLLPVAESADEKGRIANHGIFGHGDHLNKEKLPGYINSNIRDR